MPTIKAIETRYAGCRFRSRLEARWAVFFDDLGIKWEYEREGYEIEDRLRICNVNNWYYLPDFWLPGYGLHVEVKGTLNDSSMRKVLSTAAFLSSPVGGCNDGDGHDTLLLGEIPKIQRDISGEYSTYPFRLHMHKGSLLASAWPVGEVCNGTELADDAEGVRDFIVPTSLLQGRGPLSPDYGSLCDFDMFNAYTTARSARFEHGERG